VWLLFRANRRNQCESCNREAQPGRCDSHAAGWLFGLPRDKQCAHRPV